MTKNHLNKPKKSKRKKFNPYQTDYFIQNGIKYIDYKDTNTLRKFINLQLRIIPQSRSKLTRKNHLRVAVAIKRAQQMALLHCPDSKIEQEIEEPKKE